MAVEFTIGVRRESKRADPKGFENTDAACGLHALPILVSLVCESRMVMVTGVLRHIGIIFMIILWIRRTLGIPSFNPISNSLHGSDLLSKCSNLVFFGLWPRASRPYFDCAALHYLCHPIQLESINVFEFYGNYEIVNKTRKNEYELLE